MSRKKRRSPLVAVDIETNGFGGDVVYWSWSHYKGSGGRPVNGASAWTAELVDMFLNDDWDGAFIVAHCGMRFDFVRLDFKLLLEMGYEASFYSSLSGEIRGFDIVRDRCSWSFRDSFTFTRLSLDDFAKLFAGEKKMESPDWRVEKFDARKHADYAVNDARILYSAVLGYAHFLGSELSVSVHSAITAAGYSLAALKRDVRRRERRGLESFPARFDRVGRYSYYGGLTQAFWLGEFRDVTMIDINSCYGYVMSRYPLPAGEPAVTKDPPECEHLVCARIRIPSGVYPILSSRPVGIPHGRYAGHIEGVWWSFEVELQRKLALDVGKDIDVQPFCYVGFSGSTDEVSNYILRLKGLRQSDPEGPLGHLAKILTNAVYGKFGSSIQARDVVMSGSPPSPNAIPYQDPLAQFEDPDTLPIWLVPKDEKDKTRVFWASCITARARCYLVEKMRKVGLGKVIYCDTDSMLLPRRLVVDLEDDLGDDYGQFKIVFEAPKMTIRASKIYSAVLEDGRSIVVSAGVPVDLPPEEALAAFRAGRINYDQLVSLRMAVFRPRSKRGGFSKPVSKALASDLSIRIGHYKKDVTGEYWVPQILRKRHSFTPIFGDTIP